MLFQLVQTFCFHLLWTTDHILQRIESRTKFSIRPPQCKLRLQLQMPREIYGSKKQVPQFIFDCCPILRLTNQFCFDLVCLLAQLRH